MFANNVPPPAEQTITFAPVPNKIFGENPFLLTATASSGLPVAFTVISGPATIQGNQITLTGAGEVKVRALQAGNNNYKPTALERTFCVNPAKPTITVTGNLLSFGGPTNANFAYQWYRNDAAIPEATTATYTATQSGEYTLTVSVGSCISVSSDLQRVNIPEDPATEQITFFPNPTRQDLQVRAIAVAGSKIALRLIAATGKLVWQKEIAVVNKKVTEKINLQAFGAGLYVLQINTGSGWVSHKVVKI